MQYIRCFFEQREILEVDTPVLSAAAITDPFIESFQTRYIPLTRKMPAEHYYLHSSPEFPMKRLLAAGSGSIYQIAKVFRQGEVGSRHNPEFTLLEWYRDGWDHHQLMQEVEQLLTELLTPHVQLGASCFMSYQQVFEKVMAINPHTAPMDDLCACADKFDLSGVLDKSDHRDRFLELLFSHVIEPALGTEAETGKACICFVYHYPASQASLARIGQENGIAVARRFEIFINGLELGNGFHELNNAQEQRARFTADNQTRQQMGLTERPLDENFLAALDLLPDCAGVAIGIERLLMVMSQAAHINKVINFPFERA